MTGPRRDMLYVVDGMNVIGSRPDRWWRDRPAARRALVVDLSRLRDEKTELTVVFDGRPEPGEIEDATSMGLTVAFAQGRANAADDEIVRIVGDAAGSGGAERITVVTSDEGLAERIRRIGASVEGAGKFRRRLRS